MNINKLKALIPASFECECINADGNAVTETIGLKLNRFSFKTATQEEFINALKNVEKDPIVIGSLLVKLIAEWEVYEDEDGKEMLPITVDNIIDQPVDFVVNLSNAVVGKLFPNPQKAASSADGSAAAERSINALTASNDGINSQSLAVSGE